MKISALLNKLNSGALNDSEFKVFVEEMKTNERFWEGIKQRDFMRIVELMLKADEQCLVDWVNDILRDEQFIGLCGRLANDYIRDGIEILLNKRKFVAETYEDEDVPYWRSCWDVNKNYRSRYGL